MTHQGKQNWPLGGCAILYTAPSLYKIIKWHHTHRNSLYKPGKLGRTATGTIGTAVSGFFVWWLEIYCICLAAVDDNVGPHIHLNQWFIYTTSVHQGQIFTTSAKPCFTDATFCVHGTQGSSPLLIFWHWFIGMMRLTPLGRLHCPL